MGDIVGIMIAEHIINRDGAPHFVASTATGFPTTVGAGQCGRDGPSSLP
jgi:hypothetical protein